MRINRNFSTRIIDNNYLEIENLTDNYYEKCWIIVNDIFYNSLIDLKEDFSPYEKKNIPIRKNNFSNNLSDEEPSYLKIYSNDRLIFDKTLGDKSKCYLLLSNKAFEKITEQLIIGLSTYSDIEIVHYTINYKSELSYPNLRNVEFVIQGDDSDGGFIQLVKPSVFIDTLEKGYRNVVFLDSDIQIRSNIDQVFNYIEELENGPILQKSPWDCLFVNGVPVPGPKLKEYIQFDEQLYPYGVTNIVIFDQNHKKLFEEWRDACLSSEVSEIRKSEFLHDEAILNGLLWKKNIKPKLFWFFINVNNENEVGFFYNFNSKGYDKLLNMNDYSMGHYAQSFIPYDRNDIVGFHCVKDPNIAIKINKLISKNESNMTFEEKLLDFYRDLDPADERINKNYQDVNVINHYIQGPYVEVKSQIDKNFTVEFWNGKGDCEYRTVISSNMWCRPNKKYFDIYTCKVFDEDGELIYNQQFDPRGKRVYISFDSRSLGDTMAWFPYADEFRKKWDCKVIVSTFMNDLFKDQYPEIEFVNPGEPANNIYAMYCMGWFYKDDGSIGDDRIPVDFKSVPLQRTATEILGLEYKEVRAKLKLPSVPKKKKVGIGIHSTAQAKYWNNPNGWQEVVDFLKSIGYEVMVYSREGDGYMGNKQPKGVTKFKDGTLQEVIDDLVTCEFFIGLGSGLSWLAWSVGLPIFLISGFSERWAETEDNTIRIINENVCHGCFNHERLDAGDWNWCPHHKGTPRQFECTKEIKGSQVINEIQKFLYSRAVK